MNRKYLLILSAIIVAVFAGMAFLNSSIYRLNSGKNGFKRIISRLTVTRLYEKEFDQPIRDIAGVTPDNIYLATGEPGKIIVTTRELTNANQINLPITVNNLKTAFTTELYYPDLYIFGYNVPGIIKYNLVTNKQTMYPVNRAFGRCALVSASTAILRGFNANYTDEIMRNRNLLTGVDKEENNVTDKTEGGGFVTDGMLHFDQQTNRVVYNHFYSNKILFLDTNLHLLFSKTGIDTFKTYTARAKAITTSNRTSFSFVSPPKLLSAYSCVSNGTLFINSRVMADNETYNQFMNNAVIDMYDIETGAYKGSFHVPAARGKIMLKFKVYGKRLIALYKKSVAVYLIQ